METNIESLKSHVASSSLGMSNPVAAFLQMHGGIHSMPSRTTPQPMVNTHGTATASASNKNNASSLGPRKRAPNRTCLSSASSPSAHFQFSSKAATMPSYSYFSLVLASSNSNFLGSTIVSYDVFPYMGHTRSDNDCDLVFDLDFNHSDHQSLRDNTQGSHTYRHHQSYTHVPQCNIVATTTFHSTHHFHLYHYHHHKHHHPIDHYFYRSGHRVHHSRHQRQRRNARLLTRHLNPDADSSSSSSSTTPPPTPSPPPQQHPPREESLANKITYMLFGETGASEDWFQKIAIRRDPETVKNSKIVVCGGGSFGTAMAALLARNGYPVTILVRKQWVADEITIEHRNPKVFTEFLLPKNISSTTDPEIAFNDATLIILAIPVQETRLFIESTGGALLPNKNPIPILCTSKGIEISSMKLLCDILPNLTGKNRKIAFLSGPSFAREMMQQLPTAVVVASKRLDFAEDLADMLISPCFKVFTSKDVIGLEISGAVKNVLAIAAGICEGLGLGTNAMAALVTRGCSEVRRLSLEMGASPITLGGLSGVGDTFLTCFGALSRNRTVGVRLGRGEELEDILSTSTEVAEGVTTASALVNWLGSKNGKGNPYASRACVKYPILFGVAAILEKRITPTEGMKALLAMPPRQEN